MNLKLSLFVTLVTGTLLVLANPLPQQDQESSQGTVAAPTQEQRACYNRCVIMEILAVGRGLKTCEKKCSYQPTYELTAGEG